MLGARASEVANSSIKAEALDAPDIARMSTSSDRVTKATRPAF